MLSNQEFSEGIRLMPLPCVDFVVINEKDEVMVGKRRNKPAQNIYFAPGGRIRKNEPHEEAIKRISKAELGIVVDKKKLGWLGIYDHIYEENFFGEPGFGTHCIAMAWVFQINTEWLDLEAAEIQHAHVRWVHASKVLTDEEIHPFTKAYIRDLYGMDECGVEECGDLKD
jgi:colanic acid biosynthesis protein WcaH